MASTSRTDQISSGLLSKSTAAEFASISRPIILKLIAQGKLKPLKPLGTKEIRISALELLKHLIACKFPFPSDLAKAAVNFAHRMQPDHLSYTREIFRTFGISPEERVKIPLVLDGEMPAFDAAGNVVVDSPLPS
jgi:hypothetical protein